MLMQTAWVTNNKVITSTMLRALQAIAMGNRCSTNNSGIHPINNDSCEGNGAVLRIYYAVYNNYLSPF